MNLFFFLIDDNCGHFDIEENAMGTKTLKEIFNFCPKNKHKSIKTFKLDGVVPMVADTPCAKFTPLLKLPLATFYFTSPELLNQ